MGRVWRLELLGQFQATRGEAVVRRIGPGTSRLLLAYLALPVGRPHPRTVLAELLWPGSSAEQGRTNLRQALTVLRRALEPPEIPPGAVLVTDRQTVELDEGAVTADVAEFRAACRAATSSRAGHCAAERIQRLERAVSLYGGELLPGVTADWALVERAALAEQYGETLRTLVLFLEQEGALERAREWAWRAVATDPLDVTSHAALIRLLLLSGQREAAQECYQAFRHRYQQELDTEPDLSFAELLRTVTRPREESVIPWKPRAVGERRVPAPAKSEEPVPQTAGAAGLLPLPLTQFFGRETELRRLARALHKRRLVTLLGPGGIGKSRLALEAARRWGMIPGRAVWVVALQALTQPELLTDAVLLALGLARPEGDALTTILPVLARQPTLLLLDNLEHLLPAGAAFVQTLLERVPTLTVLLTSRQPLELQGEQEFWVAPLPVPAPLPPDVPVSPRDLVVLSQCPSVTLFVDRARLVRAPFGLTTAGAGSVVTICRELEGIPLALELAAGAMRTKSLQEIHTGLKERLDSFHGGRRFPGRHQTLRAAFDWSYELLTSDLQKLFRQLSVFRGGWTVAAAEAVCPIPDIASALERLRECSLIVAEEVTQTVRYRMLETLREYAAEKLQAAGEEGDGRRRHLGYFHELAVEAEAELTGPAMNDWMKRLEQESENLRAALDRTVALGAVEAGLHLAGALETFWVAHSPAELGERLEALLARPEATAPSIGRARALKALALVEGMRLNVERAYHLERAQLALHRALGDRRGLARALPHAGFGAHAVGKLDEAEALFVEGVTLAEELGDLPSAQSSLAGLGVLALQRGQLLTATTRMEAGLAVARGMASPQHLARGMLRMGNLAWTQGEYARARAYCEESLAIARQLLDPNVLTNALKQRAALAIDQGDYPCARALLEESLARQRDRGDPGVFELSQLGQIALCEGDLEQAQALLEQVRTVYRESGARRAEAGVLLGLAWVALYRRSYREATALGEKFLSLLPREEHEGHFAYTLHLLGLVEARQGEWQAAKPRLQECLRLLRQMEQWPGVWHILEGFAAVAIGTGDPALAARLLGHAASQRERMGTPVPPVERPYHEDVTQAARTALGEEAFAAAWAEGQGMSLLQASALALGEADLPPTDRAH